MKEIHEFKNELFDRLIKTPSVYVDIKNIIDSYCIESLQFHVKCKIREAIDTILLELRDSKLIDLDPYHSVGILSARDSFGNEYFIKDTHINVRLTDFGESEINKNKNTINNIEKLEYEKTIRLLKEELDISSLIKNWWWIIAAAIALGITVGKFPLN